MQLLQKISGHYYSILEVSYDLTDTDLLDIDLSDAN